MPLRKKASWSFLISFIKQNTLLLSKILYLCIYTCMCFFSICSRIYVWHRIKRSLLARGPRLQVRAAPALGAALERQNVKANVSISWANYSRLQQVGIWMWDALGCFSFFLWFGLGGQSYSQLSGFYCIVSSNGVTPNCSFCCEYAERL